jgi:hypothetical protein
LRFNFVATACRNCEFTASLHNFGRNARFQARLSAIAARYRCDPPCRETSRLTVEGARANASAIDRSDRPATRPREISSRSAKLSASRDRRRVGGLIPPLGHICAKTLECDLPKARAIASRPSPFFHRLQSSALSAAVYIVRFIIDAPHLDPKVALRRSVEFTKQVGR